MKDIRLGDLNLSEESRNIIEFLAKKRAMNCCAL